MRYRPLGRTGLEVSVVSLGTVEIGMDYGIGANGTAPRPTRGEAERLLHRALDLGINLIDTARAYGEAEAIIGGALRGKRQDFVLATKVLPGERSEIIARIEESLRKLGPVDIMMLHSAPIDVIESGAAADVLLELRERGWFRFVGASVYGEEAALAAIRCGYFDCLQIAYSILDRRPERRIIPEAKQSGVGLVARSVLLKGALTYRYRLLPDELNVLKNAVKHMEALANGNSLAELAYRYVTSSEVPETALVGTGSVDELEQVIGYAEQGGLPLEALHEVQRTPLMIEYYLDPGNWS